MDRNSYIKGLISGFSAFFIWGLLPLYWKLVSFVTPYQVFAHRVVWSFVFIVLIMANRRTLSDFYSIIRIKTNWIKILGPSFFISVNWLLYIWAVNNDRVIETSLGYYINPLVVTLLGAIFLKERLTRLQLIGVAFATAGVLFKTITYGSLPIISLSLAISFSFYGFLKKKSPLSSLMGLGFETLVISIPSIIFLIMFESKGLGISGNLPFHYWFIIMSSGIVTSIPLLLFSEGAKRLPLNVTGFLQYIAPSIMLFLGIFIFKEPFDSSSLFTFILIWIGLVFFSYSQFLILKRR